MATNGDEIAQDYLRALQEEVVAVDEEIQELFATRDKLFQQRERVLAPLNADDK
jgi:hypothetical protein